MWKLGVSVMVFLLCGCSASVPLVMLKNLPGSYELSDSGWSMRLSLRQDGTYTETLRHKDGSTERSQSSWKPQAGTILLEDFLIPAGLLPESLLHVGGREIGKKTASGSIRFEFALFPETTLSGGIKLYVSPDEALAFKKLADTNARQ